MTVAGRSFLRRASANARCTALATRLGRAAGDEIGETARESGFLRELPDNFFHLETLDAVAFANILTIG
jgi:hypothetical protein